MLAALFAVLASAAARPAPSANFAANLAYRSPSLTVSELEIPLHTVEKRLGKRYNDIWTGNVSFPWGVASGDRAYASSLVLVMPRTFAAYDTSVILQTVAQKKDLGGVQNSPSSTPICLHWIVTKKDGFNASSWVQDGTVSTDVSLYYAAKVEATGLEPYTQYNYRFESCAGPALGTSIVGTFKTLPSETQTPPSIKMAVFSCSNLPYGFFNAYGAAANHSDTLDYWQHLGDYIYEYRSATASALKGTSPSARRNGDYGDGTATGRVPQPADRECTTLQDYRDRYASYRRDPDLVRLHQKLAVQAVWDDHEVRRRAQHAPELAQYPCAGRR
jgi:alkaline phosphatase D